jgi:hypothetical protein
MPIAVAQELCQFVVLAVGQGVHRVDDDGLNAFAGAALQNEINNGHDVCEALAGAGACRQHVIRPLLCDPSSIFLVRMEPHLLADAVRLLILAENVGALLVEQLLFDKVVNPRTWLKRRIELNQRLRPQHPFVQPLCYVGLNRLVVDIDEALNIAGVIADQLVAEIENIHVILESSHLCRGWRRCSVKIVVGVAGVCR